MFGKIKHKNLPKFDPDNFTPAMRVRICTGERVLGFMNKKTGKFYDVSLVTSNRDVEKYCKVYKIDRDDIQEVY